MGRYGPPGRVHALLATCLLPLLACGGNSVSSPDNPIASGPTTVAPTSGPFTLRASPIEPAQIDFILPLGNLNPPGHTFPTDHIYFYVGFLRPEIRGVPVFAPGDGTVRTIFNRDQPDVKIYVRATSTVTYYIDHVVLDPQIREGMQVTAGQRLGTSGTGGFGIDFGVVNDALTLTGFVNPARYPTDTIHADAPLKYYVEPMRSQLYGMVRREGGDRDGKIDFDVAGRLIGNWFLEGLPVSESAQPAAWPKHLAFVFDNVLPTERRIAIGGTLALTGQFGVDAAAPAFDAVTPQSGIVTFRLLMGGAQGGVAGTMLAQMLDASRVRVEVTRGGTPQTAFTSAAQIYSR